MFRINELKLIGYDNNGIELGFFNLFFFCSFENKLKLCSSLVLYQQIQEIKLQRK
jgi:hypothetical protein